MNILLYIFGNVTIITAFVIMMIGAFYVLAVELQYLLEVDVLWRVKRKVRAIVYAETKSERKTLGRMFSRRKGRGKPNRAKVHSIAKRLFRRKDKSKAVQEQKIKTVKQVVKD